MLKYSIFEHQQEKLSLVDRGIWLPEMYQGPEFMLNHGQYWKHSDGN